MKTTTGADGEYSCPEGPIFVGGVDESSLESISNDQGWAVFTRSVRSNDFEYVLSPPLVCQRCKGSNKLRFRPSASHTLQLVRLCPAASSCCLSISGKCRSVECQALNDYFGYTVRTETWSADPEDWATAQHPVTWASCQGEFIQASQELFMPRNDLHTLQIRLVRCDGLLRTYTV
jgi:hypothetical protein